jgi:flagellar biosynthesis protein FliR
MGTYSFLASDLFVLGLIFIRVSGFAFTAPFISERFVPPQWKVLGSLLFSVILLPNMNANGIEIKWESFIWIAPLEFGIGAILGVGLNLVFEAIRSAGDEVGNMIGLRFQAGDFDLDRLGLGELLYVFAGFLFVALAGDRVLIRTFVEMYDKLPVGVYRMGIVPWQQVISFGSVFLVFLVKLALPLIALMLIFYTLAGVFEHFFSNFDVFSMIFPAAIMLGLWALWAFSPQLLTTFEELFKENIELVKGAF